MCENQNPEKSQQSKLLYFIRQSSVCRKSQRTQSGLIELRETQKFCKLFMIYLYDRKKINDVPNFDIFYCDNSNNFEQVKNNYLDYDKTEN